MMRRIASWVRRKSPWVMHVPCGGCNGCDIEVVAAFIPPGATDRALTDTDRAQVRRAAVMLSIAEKFPLGLGLAGQVEDLKGQIGVWMTGRGALENGRRFFDLPDYEPALQEFRRAGSCPPCPP